MTEAKLYPHYTFLAEHIHSNTNNIFDETDIHRRELWQVTCIQQLHSFVRL